MYMYIYLESLGILLKDCYYLKILYMSEMSYYRFVTNDKHFTQY